MLSRTLQPSSRIPNLELELKANTVDSTSHPTADQHAPLPSPNSRPPLPSNQPSNQPSNLSSAAQKKIPRCTLPRNRPRRTANPPTYQPNAADTITMLHAQQEAC
jgi:hypothetical protein